MKPAVNCYCCVFFVCFLKCTNVLTRSSGITGSQCFIFFNHVHGFVQQQQKECLFGVALFLVGVCTGPALSALKSVVYQQVNRVCSYKCWHSFVFASLEMSGMWYWCHFFSCRFIDHYM